MANRIHFLEEELDRIEDAKEDEVRVVESRQKAAYAKTEDLKDEVRELKRDLERVEQEKRDSEHQMDKISSNLEKKYAAGTDWYHACYMNYTTRWHHQVLHNMLLSHVINLVSSKKSQCWARTRKWRIRK